MERINGTPRIAIVDDQVFFRRGMTRLLRACGIEVDAFASGSDFIDRLETSAAFQPACAVLDMQMPGMSGLEVQAWLATARPGMPTIFVSGAYHQRNRELALAAGAAAYFEKPLDDESFLLAIYSVIETNPPRS